MKFKLKYQDGATKKICMLLASAKRKHFSELLWSGKLDIPFQEKKIDFDIISFSGKRDFEEQMLSIFSFLFYVGIPLRWTIYEDGSYTNREKEYLLKKFPFIKCLLWNNNKQLESNQLLQKYLETCHLSKKLHAILGHEYQRQTIYIDSDIVFYNNASTYFNSEFLQNDFWYIPETNWGSFKDKGINSLTDMFTLNSGLLILNKNFDFNNVLAYLKSLNSNFEYFSEQNSFDYSFKKQKASALDPRQFIINLEDQFDLRMSFKKEEMALRHYVTPVRHKMWQKGWRWHFKF